MLYDEKEVSSSREHNNLRYICEIPWWLSGEESICNAEDMGSIPGLGRSPEEENGNPFQYSFLENPVDRGDWQATVHGVSKELDII